MVFMNFDTIKQYFLSKKHNLKNQLYVLEEKNIEIEEINYFLIEQKLLELMLAENYSLRKLINCGYVTNRGWLLENGVPYERFVLNEKGKYLYDVFNVSRVSPKFLKALENINVGETSNRLRGEKQEILLNFKVNNVNRIYKYQLKNELHTEQQSERQL